MTLLDAGSDFHQAVDLPLPYRIFLLLGLGILGWATNLHGLEALDVDVVAALDLRPDDAASHVRLPLSARDHPASAARSIIRATYHVFLAYSAFCVGSWMMYRLGTKGDPLLVDTYGHVPLLTGIALVFLVWCPYDFFFKAERDKFVHAIRRCLFSSLNTPVLFSDVIFADIGTSYAKVFGDVWLSLCMLFPGNTMLSPPIAEGAARWILPAIMSFPYFVRFRQCLIEYNLPQNDSRRPFFNAVKYATSFPVIFLSAAQRVPTANQVSLEDGQAPVSTDSWHGDHQIFKLWLLAVFVNSAYSFWWDITNDWGFDLLRPAATSTRQPAKRLLLPLLHSRTPLLTRENSLESQSSTESEPSHRRSYSNGNIMHRPSMSISMSDVPKSLRKSYPYGLRPILLYPLTVYPLLIFLNLVLRMSWSVKLSSHLHSARDGSMAIFWLEVAELVRRWLWVFIRVEWEMVKRMQAAPLHTGKIEVDGISGDEAVSFEVLMPEVVAQSQVLPDA
ncbi:hypothetical protein D9611_000342 [Ephemerocybe angulata]|uniref:EXS domain-containing protein n=1 Tax=Ephemerocybe angulata TaxID=980116 RepID=A0A8H5BN40_9AGAR|nr:hypothetical protein D9611_000342 [Tulosesus angulatus]